ncbi:MAG: peptide deformylase [Bacteroidota bacterium]
MILPIVAYGAAILKKRALEINPDYPNLKQLIADMFDTMYAAKGVGLAAPQVDASVRLLIIDATVYSDEFPETMDFKKVMINPEILDESGEEWAFNEGCLSVPEIREDIWRKPCLKIRYQDENFNTYTEEYSGMIARVIQHEYDHLEGKLFVERVSNIRKILLKRRLNDISTGNIKVDYKMKFPLRKKIR